MGFASVFADVAYWLYSSVSDLYYKGMVDGVRIYNTALTGAKVEDFYAGN